MLENICSIGDGFLSLHSPCSFLIKFVKCKLKPFKFIFPNMSKKSACISFIKFNLVFMFLTVYMMVRYHEMDR